MEYLIWSHEHDAWWMPMECGYTTDINEAGRYTKAQAEGICRRANQYLPDPAGCPNEVTIPEVAIHGLL